VHNAPARNPNQLQARSQLNHSYERDEKRRTLRANTKELKGADGECENTACHKSRLPSPVGLPRRQLYYGVFSRSNSRKRHRAEKGSLIACPQKGSKKDRKQSQQLESSPPPLELREPVLTSATKKSIKGRERKNPESKAQSESKRTRSTPLLPTYTWGGGEP